MVHRLTRSVHSYEDCHIDSLEPQAHTGYHTEVLPLLRHDREMSVSTEGK